MEERKISDEEKEKLRKMIEGTKEQRYEHVKQIAQRSDEEHAGCLLGGMLGYRFYIFLLLVSGFVQPFSVCGDGRTLDH